MQATRLAIVLTAMILAVGAPPTANASDDEHPAEPVILWDFYTGG